MRDWLICFNDPNGPGLIFPEGHDDLAGEPWWELRVQRDDLPEDETDEWGMTTVAWDNTVYECLELAMSMGLAGVPVGGS